MLVRWMLAFEDPADDVLWLCKGTPREWLRDGGVIAAENVATDGGRVSFRVASELTQGRILVELRLDARPREVRVRLRAPGGLMPVAVEVNGEPWGNYEGDAVVLPESRTERMLITAYYS
jgi:hypothetical protein